MSRIELSAVRAFPFSVLALFVITIVILSLGCASEEQSKIRISGSTTILPFMERIAELYGNQDQATIYVTGGGSLKGIRELIEGKCDIAMSSTYIPEKMTSGAGKKGVQLNGFPFALDLIVPIVHPSNPIRSLTLAQLSRIYSGSIKSWDEVGGYPEPIDVVARGTSSGTERVWQQTVMKSSTTPSGAVYKDSNSGVLAHVAEHKKAIGYVSYALLNHEVKPLSVNQIVPNMENAQLGKYPIQRRLYLYTDKRALNHAIKSFLVFILSNRGQRIAKEFGFFPLDTFG